MNAYDNNPQQTPLILFKIIPIKLYTLKSPKNFLLKSLIQTWKKVIRYKHATPLSTFPTCIFYENPPLKIQTSHGLDIKRALFLSESECINKFGDSRSKARKKKKHRHYFKYELLAKLGEGFSVLYYIGGGEKEPTKADWVNISLGIKEGKNGIHSRECRGKKCFRSVFLRDWQKYSFSSSGVWVWGKKNIFFLYWL